MVRNNMRNNQSSTTVRKPRWSHKDSPGNNSQTTNETVTLTKAELKSLLDAAIGQNPSPSGYIDFYNNDAYDMKNEDGNESGYPASPDTSPVPATHQSFANHSSYPMDKSFPPTSKERSARTKLEEKRRQWEKEKQELVEWDPWGRPGGGAPRQRSQSLNQIPSASSLPLVGRGALNSSQPRQSDNFRNPSKYSLRSSVDTAVSSQRVPEYLRSSLPFGPNSADQSNDETRELWLREELGNRSLRNDSIPDVWYDNHCESTSTVQRHTSFSSPLSPTQHSGNTQNNASHARGQGVFELDSGRAEKLQKAIEYRRFIEGQMQEKQQKQQEEKERKRREEEEEEKRLEEERKRIQLQFEEEQRKIKEKEELEERKRSVLLEAVKNAQESAEADKRAKRAQKFSQGKKPIEPQRSSSPAHSIASSVKANKTQATSSSLPNNESEKVGSTLQGSSNHQSLNSFEEVISAKELDNLRSWIKEDSSGSSAHSTPEQSYIRIQQMATVHPIQSQQQSSLAKSTKEFGIQTDPSLSPYIKNRLLTPSQWRIKERLSQHHHSSGGMAPLNVWGCCRDMSSQTEANNSMDWKASTRRKVEHSDYAIGSSSSSCCSSATLQRANGKPTGDRGNGRLNKATHNNEEQYSLSDVALSQSGTESHKPKWGVNKPSKNFVKMTERDPNCRRRKKLQEMRKQHWEKELASQKAMSQTKKMVLGSQSNNSKDVEKSHEQDPRIRLYKQAFSESLGSTYNISHGQKVYARVPPVQSSDNSESAVVTLPPLNGRWSRSSDSLPNVVFQESKNRNAPNRRKGEIHIVRHTEGFQGAFEQPVRRKWHSQETFLPSAQENSGVVNNLGHGPGLSYSSNHDQNQPDDSVVNNVDVTSDDDNYLVGAVAPTPRRKWSEQGSFDLEKMALLQAVLANHELESSSFRDSNRNGHESSSAKSSAGSQDQRSREHGSSKPSSLQRVSSDEKDPLVNPNVITERPTPRQDKILEQLSTLRRGLLLKQQEIESRLQKIDP